MHLSVIEVHENKTKTKTNMVSMKRFLLIAMAACCWCVRAQEGETSNSTTIVVQGEAYNVCLYVGCDPLPPQVPLDYVYDRIAPYFDEFFDHFETVDFGAPLGEQRRRATAGRNADIVRKLVRKRQLLNEAEEEGRDLFIKQCPKCKNAK